MDHLIDNPHKDHRRDKETETKIYDSEFHQKSKKISFLFYESSSLRLQCLISFIYIHSHDYFTGHSHWFIPK